MKGKTAEQNTHNKVQNIKEMSHLQSKVKTLCLNRKYEIANYMGNNLLNKRTEIFDTCRGRNK